LAEDPAARRLTSYHRQSEPAARPIRGLIVAAKRTFTRIPKTQVLIEQGVPVEALPTYLALSDHASNKNGLCWPKMETLAKILGRSVRTVQRHLHLLKELGLVEFVHRRRHRGRFSSYLYRVVHFVELIRRKKGAATTGHGRPLEHGSPNRRRTRQVNNPPLYPPKDPYRWWMGKDTQYHDEELPDEKGQMKLLVLAEQPVGAPKPPENTSEGSDKGRRRQKPQKDSKKPRLF
jgi:DNA-binding transcriptional ArsR family regulator